MHCERALKIQASRIEELRIAVLSPRGSRPCEPLERKRRKRRPREFVAPSSLGDKLGRQISRLEDWQSRAQDWPEIPKVNLARVKLYAYDK